MNLVFENLPVEIQYLYFGLGGLSVLILVIGMFSKPKGDMEDVRKFELTTYAVATVPLILGLAAVGLIVLKLKF